ncbi:MAG: diguanylate cyclase [Myxococcales bacterium]|nr:diguanylate cyclase [Myxococcales bacterium]
MRGSSGDDDLERTDDALRGVILCVDDEPMNLELLERSLRRRFDVVSAASPDHALDVLRSRGDVAVVLSDFRMPGMNGAELLAAAARLRPETRRVLLTGYADAENLIASINAGQVHYVLRKPWKHQELHQLLEQMVRSYDLERENRRLVDELRGSNERLEAKERLLERTLRDRGQDLTMANAELDRVHRELEVLSYRDGLTGLYNHRAFQERLREEVSRAQRYGQPISLLLTDVDAFVTVNQELGYQIGDEVLRRLASVLVSGDSPQRVRASDIIARYSGEEFVILLPETSKSGAITKANRLREAVARAEFPVGRSITISVGVAALPDDAASADALIQAAESALRGAKRNGRNRVHFFSRGDVAADREPTSLVLPTEPPDVDRFRPYHERMGEVIAILQRDRSVSCLFVDLNRLRRIEIDFGVAQHAEIYERAGVALDELRGDLLRIGDLVCRTNDDDAYVVILAPREQSSQDELLRLAARVEDAVEHHLTAPVKDLLRDQPRITVGAARVLGNSMLRPERQIARLVSEATEAAKLARQRSAQRNKAALQDVILNDGLWPVYQPIVHIESGDIFGFEALTRGPRQTPMESPATLFAIADEVDHTFELDRACFRGALRGAVGLEPVHRLFVNLLPLSFYDSGFIEIEVSHLLEAAALTPSNIVFEITERLAIENFTSFRRALATYTAMGFGVAIDDVGTRHSNLETVMALRPHFIKISDVLTRGVAHSTVKREMLRSLRLIADAIDAVMVAEGIETADDLMVLHDLGVKYGQGFFLARPGPPFPRLRASVRRAIRTLVESSRAPIAAPPAEYDDEGDVREGPPLIIDDGHALARGSGELVLPAQLRDARPRRPAASAPPFPLPDPGDDGDDGDDAHERTSPHLSPWQPLRPDDLGHGEDTGVPLLDSLQQEAAADSEDSRPGTEPGKGLN